MASNVIDYFSTLGRKSLVCKSFESLWADDKAKSPSEIWNEAITDIAVVHSGERLPDSSWQIIDRSIDNRPIMSRNGLIAVRRRSASKRLDHITKIKLIKKGDVIPFGFELIERSITKQYPADLENVGALAIKRATASEVMFIEGEPLVDDVCLILSNDGEEVPEGYVSLERISNVKESLRSSKASQTAVKIVLAYHQRPAMGLCDLSYESATLDRYPQKDQTDFPLPVLELPMFAFPHDLRLTYSSTVRFPLPVFFSFVFTNSKGHHRYAACLRFYEIVPKEEIEIVFREVYGHQQEFVLLPTTAVFCPKVICVVSRMPFYRAMRRYLCQIFSMSLSSLPCPLEFFIASVVGQVPLPVAGGRPFHVIQDAALISSTSCAMNPIEFQVPLPRFFPPMDLDFAAPLRCLSVERLLAVFALMLRESKIVFLCCSNTLLTETMETLRSLLFPLRWSSCFVSRLPDVLSGLLEAPGGFMIGLHMFKDKDNDVEVAESTMDKHFGDRKAVRQVQWTHSLTAGTFIVDLSSNAVFQYGGKNEQIPLSVSSITSLAHTLPPGPRKRLQKKLQKIATEYLIGPQTVGLDRFDSAFDFQSYEDVTFPAAVSALQWEAFPTLEIRDSFMCFMADLLGNYQKYIIPPLEDMRANTYRTFKEEFSVEEYLLDAGPTVRPILSMLVDTQMFAVLLQQRSEASDYSLVFFESAGELMREYKLQAGGHGVKDSNGSAFSTSSTIPDISAPLYKLLAAKAWAAASGKYHHTTDAEKEKEQSQLLDYSETTTQRDVVVHTESISVPKTEEKKYFLRRTPLLSKRLTTSSPPSKSDPPKKVTALDYLLAALDEMELETSKRVSSLHPISENGFSSKKNRKLIVGARNELDKQANLRLHDKSLGPLIIPGPSKALLNTHLTPSKIITGSNLSSKIRRFSSSHENLSPGAADDTNSIATVLSYSTDVSDNDSMHLPSFSKSIAEMDVSCVRNPDSRKSEEEHNHFMAVVAFKASQSRSPLETEECSEMEYESDVERDSEGRFTYQIGWPVLNSKLLKLARRSVHTRLSGLRKSRVFALQMINRNIQLFLRAPTEQWACYRSIAYTKERTTSDMDSSTTSISTRSHNASPASSSSGNLRSLLSGSQSSVSLLAESQLVINAVMEVLSVSLLLLCTRTLHEAKPVSDMLQVLGILAQADHMGVLQKFDETIWRTLLVACASIGGDVVRRMACVIFDTLTVCGITPDALTFGSYTRALAATKCKYQIEASDHQMDQFLFLEEIGLAWFQQRSAVIEQAQSEATVSEPRSGSTTGINSKKSHHYLSTMFTRRKRAAVPVQSRAKTANGTIEMTGASDSAIATASQLGLIRPSAALSLLCPSGTFVSAPPRSFLSFKATSSLTDLSEELSGRIEKLVMGYKPPSPPARGVASFPSSRSKSLNNLELSLFPDEPIVEAIKDEKITGKVARCDPGDDTEGNDLIGPAKSTASSASIYTDNSDTSVGTGKFSEESRSSLLLHSALESAASSSSAAATTVKHYSNRLYGGIPTSKRTGSVSVPEEVLHQMVKMEGTPHVPLVESRKEGEASPSGSFPGSVSFSRMSRLTQSVFYTSKEKEKELEREKQRELVKSQIDDVFSINSPQSTPRDISPDNTAQKGIMSLSQYAETPELTKRRDSRGSILSIHFSDDEEDGSEDESAVTRRSSSGSIPAITPSSSTSSPADAKVQPSENDMTRSDFNIQAAPLEDVDGKKTKHSQHSRRGSLYSNQEASPTEEKDALKEDNSEENDSKDNLSLQSINLQEKETRKIEKASQYFKTPFSVTYDKDTPSGSLPSSPSLPSSVELPSSPSRPPFSPEGVIDVTTALPEKYLNLQELDGCHETKEELVVSEIKKKCLDGYSLEEVNEVIESSDDEADEDGSPIEDHLSLKGALQGGLEGGSRRGSSIGSPVTSAKSEKRDEYLTPTKETKNASVAAQTPLVPKTTIPVPLISIPPVPVHTGGTRVNVLAMQVDLLDTFSSAFTREGSAIGIHSATPCPSCSHILLDEEVMAAWCRLETNPCSDGLKSRSQNSALYSEEFELNLVGIESPSDSQRVDSAPVASFSDMKGSDIEAAHCIACPVCATKFSPQLHVQCYELKPCVVSPPTISNPSSPPTSGSGLTDKSSTPTSAQTSPLLTPDTNHTPSEPRISNSSKKEKENGNEKHNQPARGEKKLVVVRRESVSQLSPKGLRLALEEQMERIGERVADPCWLHVHRPAVYWNIIWFSARLKVPTGFLASPPPGPPNDESNERGEGERLSRPDTGSNLDFNSLPQMWHLPSVIGWKQHAVEAQIQMFLSRPPEGFKNQMVPTAWATSLSSLNSHSQRDSTHLSIGDSLQVADLFPGCLDFSHDCNPNQSADSISSHLIQIKSSNSFNSTSPSPLVTRSSSSPLLMSLPRSNSSSSSTSKNDTRGIFKSSPSHCSTSTPTSTNKSSPVRQPIIRLDRAIGYLDGSAEGMRRAILEIGKYQLLIESNANNVLLGVERLKSQDDGPLDSEKKLVGNPDQLRAHFNIDSPGGDVSMLDVNSLRGQDTTNLTTMSTDWDVRKKTVRRNDSRTIARDIYIDLLTLSYIVKSRQTTNQVGTDGNTNKRADLFKEPLFEKLYLYAVRDLLTAKDYQALGTTENDMSICVAGRTSMAYRIGMGFLF